MVDTMRNIVIVDCESTGINFIEDIVNMGYGPVVLESQVSDSEVGIQYRKDTQRGYKKIKHDFELIYEQDTYEETLELVSEYDPILVLPGTEKGVILATKLANDLNLLCNSLENLDAMTQKDEMQNRLAENGLRHIRGKIVETVDEALEFYESEGLDEVVLKPIHSAGSTNVRICMNRQEMVDAFNETIHESDYFGDHENRLLIQERISGDEYIVNTVSSGGIHRVTTIMKYNKVRTSDGAMIYESSQTVNELSLGEAEMVEYAYNVADAIGIEYGPVHGEYMLDEKGPVLIEVNCRPMGADMDAEFLDRISGQHETDSILKAYLKPDLFRQQLGRPYRLYAYGALKHFIIPNDMMVSSVPMNNIGVKLKSHYKSVLDEIGYDFKKQYFKTVDLHSSCGIIYLVHEDLSEVQNNLQFLRDIEKNAFSLVLDEGSLDVGLKDDNVYVSDIRPLVENVEKYGIGLLVTDQFIDDVNFLQVSYEGVDDVIGDFDFLLINLNRSIINNRAEDVVKILLDSFSRVKKGGYIFIPKNTYELFSSGRGGMEALLIVLNLKIEVPPVFVHDMIVASKR